jgi:hypothetical protein
MMRMTLIATLFASLLGAGEALARPAGPYTPSRAATVVRPEMTVWTTLGEARIGGRRGGKATLTLDRRAQPVTKLRIALKQGNANVRAVRVTFANGMTHVADVRGQLNNGRRFAVIDLPGQARFVRSVEIVPVTSRRSQLAVVEISGDTARRGPFARR